MVLTIHSEFSFEDSPTPILSLYFSSLSDIFTWKMVRQRERLFPSLVHSLKNCNPQDWAWLKPGRNHSILASHISAGVPNMWSIFFFPMCITRKPDGKQSYRVLNMRYYMGASITSSSWIHWPLFWWFLHKYMQIFPHQKYLKLFFYALRFI